MGARPVTCCFTGHRPEKLPWGDDEADPRCRALKRKLADAVEARRQREKIYDAFLEQLGGDGNNT